MIHCQWWVAILQKVTPAVIQQYLAQIYSISSMNDVTTTESAPSVFSYAKHQWFKVSLKIVCVNKRQSCFTAAYIGLLNTYWQGLLLSILIKWYNVSEMRFKNAASVFSQSVSKCLKSWRRCRQKSREEVPHTWMLELSQPCSCYRYVPPEFITVKD